MQERSAVLKQFPAVGRRTACGHPCGPCGEGLFKDVACVWHGGRVARGGAWGLGARVMAGGNAGTPRAAHLWIPAFAGTTVGVGGGGSGRTDLGSARATGWGNALGGDAPRHAPALGSRFRGNDGGGVAQGERIWGRACDGVGGVRWGRGTAPRRAPALGSRFRGNDGGARERRGGAGTTGGWVGVRWGWVGVRWRGGGAVAGWGLVGWVLGDGWLVVVAQSRGGAGRSQLGLLGCLVFLVANGLTEVQYFAVI